MADAHSEIELWDAAAERFAEILADGSDWRQSMVLRPAVLDCLGSVAGEDVLDAGCGPGFLTAEMARRGARVTSFDGSPKMVTLARERMAAESVRATVLQADLCCELPFSSNAFDAIVCNMVLMDMAEISSALAEFHRTLRCNGRLVLSITHPAFFPQCWEKDVMGRKLWKKPVEDYLTARSEIINMCGGPTRHHHRPLSYYVAELCSAGFVLDAFAEPVPTFDRTSENEYAWRVPDFVVMRALPR